MNRKFILPMLIAAVCMLVGACRDEPAMPKLRAINEAVIHGIDSVYVIDLFDKLTIVPEISFTQDSLGLDTARYRYEWIFILQPPTGDKYPFRTISTGRTLDDFDIAAEINDYRGVYDFTFRIWDSHIDIFTEFPFRVVVANEYHEGWIVLHESRDTAYVDMLSYHPRDRDFAHLTNVVTFPGGGDFRTGKAAFISCVFDQWRGLSLGGTLVGTSQDILALSEDDFTVIKNYYRMDWELSNAASEGPVSPRYYGQMYNHYVHLGTTFFNYNEHGGGTRFEPISIRRYDDGTSGRFRAAPFLGIDAKFLGSTVVMFDEDANEFMWFNWHEHESVSLATVNGFDRLRDWELLYLAHTRFGGGQYCALLRDAADGTVHVMRFTLYELLEFGQVRPESPLAKAQQFVLDPNTGRFYYASGRSVYEYKGVYERKVADFDGDVTLLKFNQYQMTIQYMTGSSVNKERYDRYETWLLVATHDEKRPNDGGKLSLYDPVEDRIVDEFTGFRKIVDVTYKER